MVAGVIQLPRRQLSTTVIALSFPGQYKGVATAFPVRKLTTEDDIAALLAEVDKYFQKMPMILLKRPIYQDFDKLFRHPD